MAALTSEAKWREAAHQQYRRQPVGRRSVMCVAEKVPKRPTPWQAAHPTYCITTVTVARAMEWRIVYRTDWQGYVFG